jgi:hypothetical protein
MPGRRLLSEDEALAHGYGDPVRTRRRAVLRETLEAFRARPDGHYHALARENLARWRAAAEVPTPAGEVVVRADDWGVAAQELTRRYGVCFAVLNMANAYLPGGGYVEGMAAQEENLFRRSDCHLCVGDDEMDPDTDRYRPWMTALLEAEGGRVHLDTQRPRVCIRGPEEASAPDLGYRFLADDEVFPFYELRAAAVNLRRHPGAFDPGEARRRIAAQLDTLREHGVRHAVLSAFGCGAFRNPAEQVARLYRAELDARRADFALVTFAIFHPGYGPDNFTPFAEAFA